MNEKGKTYLKKMIGDNAYQLGYDYERTYKGCGQCTIAALQDTFGVRDDAIYKSATSIAGGAGLLSDVGCSTYVGGVLFLGSLRGRTRDDMTDEQRVRFETHAIVRKLHDRFVQEYGTVVCRDMHMRLYGRYFYLPDSEEFSKFHSMGAHDRVCPDVVGKGCRWVAELVVDEELLSEDRLRDLAGYRE